MNSNYLKISSSIVAGIFIYFRKLDYYKSIPRESILTSFIIIIWSMLTLNYPIFLVIGLMILNIFGYEK